MEEIDFGKKQCERNECESEKTVNWHLFLNCRTN